MFLDRDSKQKAFVGNYLLSSIILYVPCTVSQTGSDCSSASNMSQHRDSAGGHGDTR